MYYLIAYVLFFGYTEFMPKIVDHEERRERIAKAMWQVILDKGMEGATVRNIAQEAGLSLGALRHYFQNQDDLLVYAMTLVKDRVTARIEAIMKRGLPPKEMVMAMLLEIVPINEETRIEMDVWFVFVAHVKHRKDTVGLINDGLFEAFQKMVGYLHSTGWLKEGLSLEFEIERLYALIDGLAMHALLDPDRVDRSRVIDVIRYHLDSICRA
ncbi:HTH-type transcriptional regulator PksA [Paenibacillus woosongensis]|uniref:HTH-type transcriptional regulator PksA n=2 Tax=Paenibacillus TaxID=44249 RepID=A0ABQ4MLP2_9BACL|nr:HTH-type transcriptional regulator PksA [Paenibacillus woosongensis]